MYPITTQWLRLPGSTLIHKLRGSAEIQRAARDVQAGKLVAFPTETVYGLGANATLEEAVRSIFEAKGRPQDNPLIIHIGEKHQLEEYAKAIPSKARKLVDHFWPGPLTLILTHKGNIATTVTAGLETVGIRMPDHPVAQALLQVANVPIAAPSANISGRPSPTEAKHVWEDLHGRIHTLLDAGQTGMGVESTIVDMTQEVPVILRPGGVTIEQIEEVIGKVEMAPNLTRETLVPIAPGMKYTHYAPKGEMFLVKGDEQSVRSYINGQAYKLQQEGKKVGILTTEENAVKYDAAVVLCCGKRADPKSVAQKLYAILRTFDVYEVEYIFSETFPEEGLFLSVMNRLEKAAGGRVILV